MQLSLYIGAAILLLDQLTKWVILLRVMDPPRVIEVTGFFNLVLTYNTGVSFGLFQGDAAWQPYILVFLNLAVSAGLLIWLHRETHKGGSAGLLPWAVGLVVGGALGNAVDRLHLPGVVDFLDFHLAGWHWPAFNVADSAIVGGVILLIADGLFQPGRKGNKEAGIGR
ncbi:signal peptidase II [Pelagibius sp. CAU 1746]|uniref:signal peptidase II n=1 Tax=Pelagibius sp. CAU 1746 TaxID=3140370 RepID=UPI00325B55E1